MRSVPIHSARDNCEMESTRRKNRERARATTPPPPPPPVDARGRVRNRGAAGGGAGGGYQKLNYVRRVASRRLFRIVDVDVAVEGMMTFSSPVSHNLPSSEQGALPGVVFAPRKLRAKTSRCHRYRRRNRPGTAAPRSEGGSSPTRPPAPLK